MNIGKQMVVVDIPDPVSVPPISIPSTKKEPAAPMPAKRT